MAVGVGGSGGGDSHSHLLPHSNLLNIMAEEFLEPVSQHFPANTVCPSDTVTARTEKLNTLNVRGGMLDPGTETCPRHYLYSWGMRQSSRGDRMQKTKLCTR